MFVSKARRIEEKYGLPPGKLDWGVNRMISFLREGFTRDTFIQELTENREYLRDVQRANPHLNSPEQLEKKQKLINQILAQIELCELAVQEVESQH